LIVARVARCCDAIPQSPARSNGSRSMSAVRPNPSVNADAPVRVFYLANPCGGAPVTLYR
jgi:hypothetical protein